MIHEKHLRARDLSSLPPRGALVSLAKHLISPGSLGSLSCDGGFTPSSAPLPIIFALGRHLK